MLWGCPDPTSLLRHNTFPPKTESAFGNPPVAPCPEQWLSTGQMAGRVRIHPKTLLRLRAAPFSPFREGVHYRRGGLTTRAPFQWHGDLCEQAFTEFGRIDPASIEAFSGAPLLVDGGYRSPVQAALEAGA